MTRRKDPETAISEEPVAEPEPVAALPEEPVTPEPVLPPIPPVAPQRRGGVFAPLLGGAIAAVAGFGLSHFDAFGLAPPDQSAEIAALQTQLESTIAGLEGRLTATETAADPAIEALAARVAALESVPAVDLSGLDALDQRLAAIESMPAGGDASTAALAAKLAELERQLAAGAGANDAEVKAALDRLATAEAEAATRAAEAANLAEATAKAAALEDLTTAINAGAGFEAELAAVADPALQAALAPHVAGVATQAQLQADFPEAARAVLQRAREINPDAGWTARLVDFLADQTEARSLTPREGDDPDAILSRAEHALTEGRLADSLTEIATLDPSITEPLQAWVAAVQARLAVEAALSAAGGL